MAPLEDSLGVQRLADLRPIDSLMRALLYVVQQVGRPLSEADVRGLAALADEPLDEQGFLTVGTRLGLQAGAVDLVAARASMTCRHPSPWSAASCLRMSWRRVVADSGRCSMSSRAASGR